MGNGIYQDRRGPVSRGTGAERRIQGPGRTIVLIGVPGAGKSTVGVVLAKELRMQFIDTDLLIQERCGRLLQEVLDDGGPDSFKEIEEEVVLSLDCRNTVLATGGSVVFSGRAMEHLRKGGIIVWLDISCERMEERLRNSAMRGIVLAKGESLRAMYNERMPLYRNYADVTIACSDDDVERIVRKIVHEVRTSPG